MVPPLAKGEVVWVAQPRWINRLGEGDVEPIRPRLHGLNFEGGVPIWFQPLQAESSAVPTPVATGTRSSGIQTTIRPPEEAVHTTLQPLGEPKNSPLDFSLHLFKLHAADPAHGQFAQEELPGKRAIMNFQRSGRRI